MGEVAVAELAPFVRADREESVALRKRLIIDRLRLQLEDFGRLPGRELRILEEPGRALADEAQLLQSQRHGLDRDEVEVAQFAQVGDGKVPGRGQGLVK